MKKTTKLSRIKGMLKRYPEVSSYLLNKYSRKVYTHADLDILEELLEAGYYNMSIIFNDKIVRFDTDHGPSLYGDFEYLRSKKWCGKPHYTSIRRSLKNLTCTKYRHYNFDSRFQFWSNPEFEFVIDIDELKISYWPNKPVIDTSIDHFKATAKEVFISWPIKNDLHKFSYQLVANPDELILGLSIVENTDGIYDPYLDWSSVYLDVVSSEEELINGDTITEVRLRRKDESGEFGLAYGYMIDGQLHVHKSYKYLEELWKRAGYYTEVVWEDYVREYEFVEDEEDEF